MAANIQRMLRPMANRIIGNALTSTTAGKKAVSAPIRIARGMVRRGPKTTNSALGKSLSSEQAKALSHFRNDACNKLAVLLSDDNNMQKFASKAIKAGKKIAATFVPKATKIKGGTKALASLQRGSKLAPKQTGKIINPKSQWKRRLGLAVGGSAIGAGGLYVGHRSGRKYGERQGYVRALEDVLSTAKAAGLGLEQKVALLQKSGVTLGQLKKVIAVAPVVGGALVREDLHGGSKKNLVKGAGYVPATSMPMGVTTRPPDYANQPNAKKVRVKGVKDVRRKETRPSSSYKQVQTPRLGQTGISNPTQVSGYAGGSNF